MPTFEKFFIGSCVMVIGRMDIRPKGHKDSGYLILFIAAIALFGVVACMPGSTGAASAGVNATVTIPCSPIVSISTGNFVLLGNAVPVYYSVNALGACRVSAQGTLRIVSMNGNATVYSAPVSINGITPLSGAAYANSVGLAAGSYYAYLGIMNQSATGGFRTLSNANVVISGLSVSPAQPTAVLPVSITQSLYDSGNLTASSVVLHVAVAGPSGYNFTTSYAVGDILPQGNEITITSLWDAAGTYYVTENASFTSAFYANSTSGVSQTANAVYVVAAQQGGQVPATNQSVTVNTVISSSAPVLLDFTSANATISISTNEPAQSPISANVANVTSTAAAAPAGYALVEALNVSISTAANVIVNMTMAYPCGTAGSDVQPFIYANGTWGAITPFSIDPASCTVSFALPDDPIVSIFIRAAAGAAIHASGGAAGSAASAPTAPVAMPATIGNLTVTTVPVQAIMQQNTSQILDIGVTNGGRLSVQADISVSGTTDLGLGLSSSEVTLSPGSSQVVQMAINPPAGLKSGIYPILLNITGTQQGGPPVSRSMYMSLLIGNSVGISPLAYAVLNMQPSANTVTATLAVTDPRNGTLYNVSASLILPSAAARSVHDIRISGAAGSVTEQNNSYVLTWDIPYLTRSSGAYLFYTITNASSALPLTAASLSFSVSSQAPRAGELTLFGMHAPTLYTNQSGYVTVEALYTGSQAENVTFTLVMPPSTPVLSASRTFSSHTNEVLDMDFEIPRIGAAGTYLMTLYVSGRGINQTYFLPLTVESPASGQAPVEGERLVINLWYLVAAGAGAAAVIIAAGTARRVGRRPLYRSRSVERLKELREQIKKGQ